jgi:hypothetical protein
VGLGETLAALPGFDVLADCGRIDSASPALGVLQQANAAIFVVRPTVADVVGLRDRLETLDLRSSPQLQAGLIVIDHGPHTSEEVATAFRLPVIGTIAWDPKCAEVLAAGRHPSATSKLLRSAAIVAADIAGQIPAAADRPAFVDSWRDPRPSPMPVSAAPPPRASVPAAGSSHFGAANGGGRPPGSSDFWRRNR